MKLQTAIRSRVRRGGNALAIGAHMAALFVFGLAFPAAPRAQDEPAAVLERRVKAALVYRFIHYVDWPETAFARPDSPFAVGVAGAEPLAGELAEIAPGRTVLNRPLVVRSIRNPEDVRELQLLFVGKGEMAQVAAIIRAAPPNALIVTEAEDGLQSGSVINLIIVEGKVRFEISLDAARRRNLHLSSRLLSVAYNVTGAVP